MDAHEVLLAELLKQVAKRSTEQVRLIGCIHAHVVIVGLEAMDAGAVNHAQPVADGNQQVIADDGLLPGYANGRSRCSGAWRRSGRDRRTAEPLFVIRLQ